jgi:flagellar motility protein MotE (MotC chaperone)
MRLSLRPSFQASISACLLAAIASQGWQLTRTDWNAFSIVLRDSIMPPVSAVGTATPRKPAPAEPAAAALPAVPQQAALPPDLAPALPTTSAPAAAPAAAAAVQEQMENEMARLLEELKAQPRSAAPTAPPKGADLARAAVTKRLDETAARLEALGAQLKSQASASAAEIAKPKTLLENMKPTEAAAIMGSMDDAMAARIAAAMEERKAAAVLAAMPSERAARITLTIRSLTPNPMGQPVAQR